MAMSSLVMIYSPPCHVARSVAVGYIQSELLRNKYECQLNTISKGTPIGLTGGLVLHAEYVLRPRIHRQFLPAKCSLATRDAVRQLIIAVQLTFILIH